MSINNWEVLVFSNGNPCPAGIYAKRFALATNYKMFRIVGG